MLSLRYQQLYAGGVEFDVANLGHPLTSLSLNESEQQLPRGCAYDGISHPAS